jgi:hypothetical protein
MILSAGDELALPVHPQAGDPAPILFGTVTFCVPVR